MSEQITRTISYPVPWRAVFSIGPNIAQRSRTSVDEFSAAVCRNIRPDPLITGWENLPLSPRFVLSANHYQRKGCWILFPAALLTQAVRKHYGEGDPPIRWIVTANWPAVHVGPFRFPSPGDILLPRVAHALACYPVSFAGSNPKFSARSVRRILKEAPGSNRPLGIFPEGVAGTAGRLSESSPGVGRLLRHLAISGLPVQPVGIAEKGRFIVRFGKTISPEELIQANDAATLTMARIAELI